MANIIQIKKGLDIPLPGAADLGHVEACVPHRVGVMPEDFPGYTWLPIVSPGDKVVAGAPLLVAREKEQLCVVSPVAGRVSEVRPGADRFVEAVVVEPSGAKSDLIRHEIPTMDSAREETVRLLCRAGLWVLMRQRPFDIVPDPDVIPRDIFVTAFDSAPLAPPVVDEQMASDLESGLSVLARLTTGRVYLGIPYDSSLTSKAARVYEFQGPHPSGNAGVQAAWINPVNKGEVIWTLDARTAVRIGRLMLTGETDASAEVVVTGPEAEHPCMIHTIVGADVSQLLRGHVKETVRHLRVVSGNVLTGQRVEPERGFLRFPYRQITLLEEGDDADEFMGWASVNAGSFSVKRSFLSGLGLRLGALRFDARLRGRRCAPILSGEYDRVFPMDIYPEFLLKAIEAGDIERMEQLGIYEVAPEDFALPEFVDTSKQPLQQIVRDALMSLRAKQIDNQGR